MWIHPTNHSQVDDTLTLFEMRLRSTLEFVSHQTTVLYISVPDEMRGGRLYINPVRVRHHLAGGRFVPASWLCVACSGTGLIGRCFFRHGSPVACVLHLHGCLLHRVTHCAVMVMYCTVPQA